MTDEHKWEDVSYHGSAIYCCEYCGCYERSPESAMPCPKAREAQEREKAKIEREERFEYKQLLVARGRFEYLEEKYGREAS